MHDSKSTQHMPDLTTDSYVTPVGGSGRVTTVTDGTTAYLICRTVRGRGGWGVHCAAGELITSGWPTPISRSGPKRPGRTPPSRGRTSR